MTTDLRVLPLDWARHTINILRQGKLESFRSIAEMSKTVGPGWKIVCEASFGSYSPEEKLRDVELIYSSGCEVYTFGSRLTRKQKRKKGDLNDLLSIEEIAKSKPLHKLLPSEIKLDGHLTPAQLFIRDRQREYSNAKPLIKKLLPAFSTLDPIYKQAFGSGSAYSTSLGAALVYAFQDERSISTKEFQKVIGFYGNGYPSVFRATIIRRLWSQKNKTRRVPACDFQRGLRYLFHCMQRNSELHRKEIE